jgi:hypothetical protein
LNDDRCFSIDGEDDRSFGTTNAFKCRCWHCSLKSVREWMFWRLNIKDFNLVLIKISYNW